MQDAIQHDKQHAVRAFLYSNETKKNFFVSMK